MPALRIESSARALGASGLLVSPLAWGMWRFAGDDLASARSRVEAALDAGINLFDTADIYGAGGPDGFGGAEALFGRLLTDMPALRERIILATKGGIVPGVPYDSSADYLESALTASLRRLRTDRIDLYQIHRPDLLAHPAELAETLMRFVRSGQVRAIGVSNYTPAQTAALQKFLPHPLASHQPEFSPLHTAPLFDGVLDQAMASDMAVLAWSPLAGGRLGKPEARSRSAEVAGLLDERAAACGVSRAVAAYAWLMAHPSRPIPIIGTQQPQRIREAADVFKVSWTRQQWYAVLEASRGEALP